MTTNGNGHKPPTGMLIVTIEGYKQVLAYVILFAAVMAGFFVMDAQGDRIERLTDDNTRHIAEIERLALDVVQANRLACQRTNVVRNNQWEGINEQIRSTEAALSKKNGLGPLESFRPQIVRQNRQRKARRNTLLVQLHPQDERPWLIDCVEAHP
jgi:hypothetical protein